MAIDSIDPDTSNVRSIRSIKDVFITEWKFWVAGAILSFMLASVLLSGWPTGLIPSLSYPFSYDGDGLSHTHGRSKSH